MICINNNEYTYSTECNVISTSIAGFNVKVYMNFDKLFCTCNVLVDKSFNVNSDCCLMIPRKDLPMSNEEFHDLLKQIVVNCQKRSTFIFKKNFVERPSNFTFTEQ